MQLNCILFCVVGLVVVHCDVGNNNVFKHFWKSTGLSPPEPRNETDKFLLSADEKFNLIYIGSLPYHGIRQVRIHWLLHLLTYDTNDNLYNFTSLDNLLDFMRSYNLRPGFELMGLPLNVDVAAVKSDVYMFWYKLTETIAKHYIERYGYEEVQKWRFETMNEPDLKQYNFLDFSVFEYLQYFNACTNALYDTSQTYFVSSYKTSETIESTRQSNPRETISARDTHRHSTNEDKSAKIVLNSQPINSIPSWLPQAQELHVTPVSSTRFSHQNNENNDTPNVANNAAARRRSRIENESYFETFARRRHDDQVDVTVEKIEIAVGRMKARAAEWATQRAEKRKRRLGGTAAARVTTMAGVHALRIGGPAGLFKQRERHPLCWGLLDMCNRSACHLHYVSFHKKGGGSAGQVLREDLAMLDAFSQYAFLRDLPVANDEADILTNWSLSKEWRGDVWYAALIAKVIIDHYKEIIHKRNVTIEVLSNDNGFLNYNPYYFTQRTLLARFQMNNTNPPHVQFIKKPVYITMGLLSMLGNQFIPTINQQLMTDINDANVHVLYTKRTSKYANILSVLIVAVNDNLQNSPTKNIQLNLMNFDENYVNSVGDNFMMTYVMDNEQTNPYQVWKQWNSSVFPDKALRRLMRENEGPKVEKTELTSLNAGNVRLSVRVPSVHLIKICVDMSMNVAPNEVINLRGYYVTEGELLLTWSDKKVQSRCIRTYEIEYQSTSNAPFKKINQNDVILLSYQHDDSNFSPDKGGVVQYRVRAVDFWNRYGPYSNVISNKDIIFLL